MQEIPTDHTILTKILDIVLNNKKTLYGAIAYTDYIPADG